MTGILEKETSVYKYTNDFIGGIGVVREGATSIAKVSLCLRVSIEAGMRADAICRMSSNFPVVKRPAMKEKEVR